MRRWHFLPDKDGESYYLKVVDVCRDEYLHVEYEIYKNECEEPIEIDFFKEEIAKIIKEIKDEYRQEEFFE